MQKKQVTILTAALALFAAAFCAEIFGQNPTGAVNINSERVSRNLVNRPRQLSSAQKTKLAQEHLTKFNPKDAPAPFSLAAPIVMTPTDGFQGSKKVLSLYNVDEVHLTTNSFARFKKIGDKGLNVDCSFVPPAIGKYLVDVTLNSPSTAVNYTARAGVPSAGQTLGSNALKLSAAIPNDLGHLTFIYEVKNIDAWHAIEIGADQPWAFYSCEISQLK